jgi:transcriptional regulator with XRE-family HTH domain
MRKSERKQLKKALREDSLNLFGEIIVKLREKEDLSQEDLAYDCGMDRSFMSKIETGKTAPSLLTIIRLAQGLNTKPSVILAMLEEKMLKEKVEIPRVES